MLKPFGVFGVIGPFNFPFALCTGMTSAALLGGNTVVLKPSEEALRSGALLAELFDVLPSGVVNVVHGGPATGRALVEADVDGIAFTGSAEVGRSIVQELQSGPYGRPALLEMGGKNPAIVTEDGDVGGRRRGHRPLRLRLLRAEVQRLLASDRRRRGVRPAGRAARRPGRALCGRRPCRRATLQQALWSTRERSSGSNGRSRTRGATAA